jgi:hypothetical protein
MKAEATPVTPAKAGVQADAKIRAGGPWIPAFAGMTKGENYRLSGTRRSICIL